MNEITHRAPNGRFLPGNPGSPGRPLGSRQKIAEALLSDLAESWKTHGKAVLDKLAKDDPGKYASIAYGLLPRDVMLTVEHEVSPFADMTPEQKRAIARKLYEQIETDAKIIEPVEPASRND